MATRSTRGNIPKLWVRGPVGPIPEPVQRALRSRLDAHARAKYAGRYEELIVRFRGAYAYVDVITGDHDYMSHWTAEERAAYDAKPTHFCRLGYLGNPDKWEFAFYKYSDRKYEISFSMSGEFEASPEDAFDTAALVYLAGLR